MKNFSKNHLKKTPVTCCERKSLIYEYQFWIFQVKKRQNKKQKNKQTKTSKEQKLKTLNLIFSSLINLILRRLSYENE